MQTQTRIVGSGFTTFAWRGKPIMFLEGFTDTGQQPFTAPEPITTLVDRHPREIATTRVLREGTLTLTIRELWNAPVWHHLIGLAGSHDIVDVYEVIAREPADVTCTMVIKSPTGVVRGKNYHGCVPTAIPDEEDVTVGALTVPKRISIMYTHATPLNATRPTVTTR